MKILFKDKLGNKIVETKEGIGLIGDKNKYCSRREFIAFIKENRLGNKIRLNNGGMLWVHNNFINGK